MDSLLDELLPAGVRYAGSPIREGIEALLPEERPYVEKAVPKRQREFATGRVLARRLLGELGHAPGPLLRTEDRLPIWPEGVVGSISHAANVCLAAVAPAAAFAGVGLDLEPDEPVDAEIERVVCRGREHDWIAAAGEAERGRRCRMVFSVKEAVYKAFYPTTRTFWSFQDVEVEIDLRSGRVDAELPESAGVPHAVGVLALREGWIVSSFVLPRV